MKINIIDILNAQMRIKDYIKETPLELSNILIDELQSNLFLKLENLQVSGSFKPRGSFNKILKNIEKGNKNDFIAPTAGGHGVGLSYAAKITKTKAHILMPKTADVSRVEDINNYGAEIQFFETVMDAINEAKKQAKKNNYIYSSAYDDIDMIEGGGTIALEVIKQQPMIDCVVCGVGGGGYLAGMSIVLKTINPNIKIYGVQQENGAFLAEWFKSGKYPRNFISKPSIAEGIGAHVDEAILPWAYLKQYVDDFLIVSEEQIRDALICTIDKQRYYVEPSAVVGLAGIKNNVNVFKNFKNICTVITGRNMSYNKFFDIIK